MHATCQSLPFTFFILGISQLWHKRRPGHFNMQYWRFSSDWSCMCISWSLVILTALYLRVTYYPTFRACTPFTHVPYVCECPWEGLGNTRHLHEWGTNSEDGAISCHVEYITPSFFTIFQFGGTLGESRMSLLWGGCVTRMFSHTVFKRSWNIGPNEDI